MFRGKFDGILVNPFLEQSTINPSLAQAHWLGHEALASKIKVAATNKSSLTDFFIFSTIQSTYFVKTKWVTIKSLFKGRVKHFKIFDDFTSLPDFSYAHCSLLCCKNSICQLCTQLRPNWNWARMLADFSWRLLSLSLQTTAAGWNWRWQRFFKLRPVSTAELLLRSNPKPFWAERPRLKNWVKGALWTNFSVLYKILLQSVFSEFLA